MVAKTILSGGDREFLSLVARAVVTNPFTPERRELDSRIAGVEVHRGMSELERIRLFSPAVEQRLTALEREGRGRITGFTGEDRRLVEYAWLFHIFHRYVDRIDGLITDQLELGEEPAPVPFAGDLLGELTGRGFSRSESLRFLALFYQLRRAFYFIAHGLVGPSDCMRRLRRSLWNSVFTHDVALYDRYLWDRMEDFSTLILGETGSGKGAAAAAVGRSGCIPFDSRHGRFAESFTRTFLSINLSQYQENLIESELFGHRKGSFTGAMDHHEGIFARVSPHGALFLDEIGEVSIPVQIKLLQVLQERTFSPVGSHQRQRFSGRVIAATNTPLERLRGSGRFRDDFFYRLSSDVITVPPLRQRIAETAAELAALTTLLVTRITGAANPEVVTRVREALAASLPPDYPWPGNVRELEQAIRRVLLTGSYGGEPAPAPDHRARLVSGVENGSLDARSLMGRYAALLHQQLGSYEAVARRLGVDRRTAKRYVDSSSR